MAYAEPPDGGDIRATLALSRDEVQNGSSRTLNLPGGRRITVSIPAGVRNGEEIRLKGQGETTWTGGPAGDLVLTVSIPADSYAGQSNPGFNPNLPTEFVPAPSFPPTSSSPNYPSATTPGSPYSPNPAYPTQPSYTATTPAGDYANYPLPAPQSQQEPFFLPQDQTAYANPAQYTAYPQPGQQAPQPYPQQPQPRRRGISPAITVLIIVLILLLLAGSGLIYYLGVYQPKVMHDQATATAQAQQSATALANSQATAAAAGTATAVAQATANAQATVNAQASATATALQNILTQATSGTPVLMDQLNAQTNSQWDILAPANSSVGGSCAFTNGAYHSIMPQKGYFQPCYAQASTFTNFAFQVDMTITQGDEGGILFRADPTNSKFYLFRIAQDGSYNLFLYTNSQGSQAQSLVSNTSSSFKGGLNQTNTITVVAQGGNIYFYINSQYVNNVSNNALSSGKIGVFGESSTSSTDVAFANAKVWQLP